MSKRKIVLLILLVLVISWGIWVNGKYEVLVVHPFFGDEDYQLRETGVTMFAIGKVTTER